MNLFTNSSQFICNAIYFNNHFTLQGNIFGKKKLKDFILLNINIFCPESVNPWNC